MNPTPVRSVSNAPADRERARILWRRSILEAGGQAWLIDRAREVKYRERDLGPHRFTFAALEAAPEER